MDNSSTELAVEITDQLFSELGQVAKSRYGDNSGATIDLIVAEELEQAVERYGAVEEFEGIEEPVAEWVPEAGGEEPLVQDSIQTWLFRGRR